MHGNVAEEFRVGVLSLKIVHQRLYLFSLVLHLSEFFRGGNDRGRSRRSLTRAPTRLLRNDELQREYKPRHQFKKSIHLDILPKFPGLHTLSAKRAIVSITAMDLV